jgi:hypothetical protein
MPKLTGMARVLNTMRFDRLTRMFAVASVVVAACACAPGAANAAIERQGVNPTEYDYTLRWNPEKRLLSGRGIIAVRNLDSASTQEVWLRLRANSGDSIARVSAFRRARVVSRRAGGSMIKLQLDTPLSPGTLRRFSFDFRLRLPRANTSLGRSAGMDLFGDAFPIVAIEGPLGLRVGPEPAYGEGTLAPVAYWAVQIQVPRGLRVVLPRGYPGLVTSRFTRRFEATTHARDFAFAIGKFTTLRRMVDGTAIEVAGSESVRSQLDAAMRRTVNAFKQMSKWYGKYTLDTLDVVVGDLPFGGSEYPGIVFSTPDNATIAHEVAHQWFYGMVGNDQYNDPFLDESLTAFAERRFHKSYRCDLARPIRGEHGLSTDMSYWEKHPAAYEDTIYRGGACALTVLQRDLGADVFDRALRAYVAANADKIAGVNDFLVAIRNAAPGYDLARWQKLVGLH